MLTQPRTLVEPCIQKLPLTITRYRDIGELMKRCETLVVTRDESKSALKRLEAEIVSEEDGLIAFKDVMNEKILKLRWKKEDCLKYFAI